MEVSLIPLSQWEFHRDAKLVLFYSILYHTLILTVLIIKIIIYVLCIALTISLEHGHTSMKNKKSLFPKLTVIVVTYRAVISVEDENTKDYVNKNKVTCLKHLEHAWFCVQKTNYIQQ